MSNYFENHEIATVLGVLPEYCGPIMDIKVNPEKIVVEGSRFNMHFKYVIEKRDFHYFQNNPNDFFEFYERRNQFRLMSEKTT